MSLSKKLPFCKTSVGSWNYHNNIHSILACYPQSEDWLQSNYVQLVCRMTKDNTALGSQDDSGWNYDFWFPLFIGYKCPWITTQYFDRNTIDLIANDIEQLFVAWIGNSTYIYTICDGSVLEPYRVSKRLRDILIFGYDGQQKRFHIAANLGNTEDNFDCYQIPSDIVIHAYLAAARKDQNYFPGRNAVQLLQFNEKSKYEFDPFHVRQQAIDYLNSDEDATYRAYYPHHQYDHIFGISVYDTIKEYLSSVSKTSSYEDIKSNNPFQMKFAHNSLMFKRVEYMGQNRHLNTDSTFLVQWEELLSNTFLLNYLFKSYCHKPDQSLYQKIIKYSNSLKEKDTQLMEQFVERIR